MLTTLFKRTIYTADEFDPNFFIPEALLKDPRFKKMSDNAKLTFILIYDRFKNYKLKDEMDNVYCEFTIRELMELLQRSESATIHIKKQLIKYDLLEQEYVIGLPSRLYIKEL